MLRVRFTRTFGMTFVIRFGQYSFQKLYHSVQIFFTRLTWNYLNVISYHVFYFRHVATRLFVSFFRSNRQELLFPLYMTEHQGYVFFVPYWKGYIDFPLGGMHCCEFSVVKLIRGEFANAWILKTIALFIRALFNKNLRKLNRTPVLFVLGYFIEYRH